MEYFVLLPDKRVANPLSFTIEEAKLKSDKPSFVNIGKADKVVVVDMVITKILFNSYFFLSDVLMKVFNMYDESLDPIPIFVVNKDYSIQLTYSRFDMEATKGAIVNKFLKVPDMLIDETCVKGKPIHKVHYEKQTYLLVNQYVAESILRRLPVGILLEKVKTLKKQ